MSKKTTKKGWTKKTTKRATAPEPPKPVTDNAQTEDVMGIGAATSWCAERGVPTRMMPEHTVRLVESVIILDRAITDAGGVANVPESVLVYRTLLHEAALATAMHGIKRSVRGLFNGAR